MIIITHRDQIYQQISEGIQNAFTQNDNVYRSYKLYQTVRSLFNFNEHV